MSQTQQKHNAFQTEYYIGMLLTQCRLGLNATGCADNFDIACCTCVVVAWQRLP